jgi:hypothetical protein
VAIGINNEQITDPAKRFFMNVYDEQGAVKGFIEQYYEGFELYKSDDHQAEENK